ncbi:T9SS type A sorting domain-containing protein [Formosa sp. S-31]|uniref:T9SS type A sorting domain-containing protein n=1 Tax=Formosa sp. S-31 TaxID=2790949 RepID=UPI003EBDDF12
MKRTLLSCAAFLGALALNAQISLVKDINPGTGDSKPGVNGFFKFNNKLYFQANDSSGENTGGEKYGSELWVTDGTEEGTMFVQDTREGSISGGPEGYFEFNGELYFSANSGSGHELFKLNAAGTGAEPVGGVPGFYSFCELDGKIYFVNNQNQADSSLWVFDGTSASQVTNNSEATLGTEVLSGGVSDIAPKTILPYKGKLYFMATMSLDNASEDFSQNIGYELYSYDPTTSEFALVKDVTPGANTQNDGAAGSNIASLTIMGDKFYFKAGIDNHLYESDGTADGTIPVSALTDAGIDGVLSLFVWNDKLYFEGDNGVVETGEVADTSSDDQLFMYDPSANTVTQISSNIEEDYDPRFYAIVGGDLYYAAKIDDDDTDYSIFRLKNGSNTPELIEATLDYDCEDLVELNGKLYFNGDDDGLETQVTGAELYVLDPATLSVKDARLSTARIYPNPATDYLKVSNELINAPYSIYDVTGKMVKTGVITSDTLNFNLNTGLYIFSAKTEVGTVTKKLVIKK